jgi:polyphosphate kinase
MDAKVASWYLASDGTWTRHQNDDQGIGLIDLQDHIMQEVYAKRNARI